MQQRSFVVVEQVVGPRTAWRASGGAQRGRAPKEPETPLQPVTDVLRAHRHHACGRELDRQRNAVQLSADIDNCLAARASLVAEAGTAAGPAPGTARRCGRGPPQVQWRDRPKCSAAPESSREWQHLHGRGAGQDRPPAPPRRPGRARSCPTPRSSFAVTVPERSTRSAQSRLGGHAAAPAAATTSGSLAGASSTSQTPSGKSWARSTATWMARRVLPTPPTPVSVTRRRDRIRSTTLRSQLARPMKLVEGTGEVARPRLRTCLVHPFGSRFGLAVPREPGRRWSGRHRGAGCAARASPAQPRVRGRTPRPADRGLVVDR